jgi:hypothetical protein
MINRVLIAGSVLGVVVAVAMGVWAFGLNTPATVDAQGTDGQFTTMQARIDQSLRVLNNGTPGAQRAAVEDLMEVLYGGFRVLPSPGDENTERWHQMSSDNERKVAGALEAFALKGGRNVDPEVQQYAMDLKLFVEQMNEVANTVAEATRFCPEGVTLQEEPCFQLQALLDEDNGNERVVGQLANRPVVVPGYSVKLRSPFLPRWGNVWDEEVQVTDPIGRFECAVVFKETRGLMLRLYFDRVITVSDPWATPQQPRGTLIPVWRMEWVPSEYVKTFNYCNVDGKVVNSVDMRVVQDVPLKYFWRFYSN